MSGLASRTADKVAVLSDVHGNLEALRAVLADIDAVGAKRLVSLGDMVGYGPEPEACVRLLRNRGAQCLMGNHELGLVEAGMRGWFNPQARTALMRTRELVSDESLEWFRTLPRFLDFAGARCVHGCPPDSLTRYLYTLEEADFREVFAGYANALSFVGHTHELARIDLAPSGEILRHEIPAGRSVLDPAARHIVNVGSAGQPRDGDNRAKYVIWTPEPGGPGGIEPRFVVYDIAKTVAGILEKGLPEVYADWLR